MTRTRQGPGAAVGESYMIPNAVFEDINGSSTWLYVINHLSDLLKLPDFTTRHGLKKAHARFNEIYKKLDGTYTAARRRDNEKVMGGVVGIMAKMCADALLRDKLFARGLLDKVMPLVEFESTLHLALNALTMVTHHGGLEARQAIARRNRTLVKAIHDHPDDPKVAELAIITMDHATEAFIACEHKPRVADLKDIVIQPVLQTTVDVFRRPFISHELFTHGFGLLCAATQHCPKECRAVPGLSNLLAAFLRSNNINMRATAMGGIIRFPISECEPDAQQFDPARMMAAVARGPPEHLLDVLYGYGFDKSEAFVSAAVTADYQKAMMQAAQDRDLYALGKKLAAIILRTEFSVSEGGYQTADGQLMSIPGLPFTRWTDALPLCAAALRQHANGNPEDLDVADVVELKFLNMRQRIPEALALARLAQRRNPRLAYAYYIESMGADAAVGLRAVKKGLRCPGLTPFLRCQMLWRATGHAAREGLRILEEAMDEDAQARAEGAAFLVSAWEDAKTFIAEAPPDTRHMLGMLGWYVLLTVVVRGPELSADLRELEPARRKIKTATDLMNWMGYPIRRTQTNLTRELILELYAPGTAEWGDLVRRFDEQDRFVEESEAPPSAAQAEDELAAWLENIDLDHDHDHDHDCDDGHDHDHIHRPRRANAPSSTDRGTRGYELYRCSWCGNPSAVLRKCGGCAKTRYCDAGCQKLHWTEHKTDCGGKKK
ncbi:hypothetical protein GSI_09710 [Ganoderma sinense ZZ0214-1]|uniref:MYND-type domain-containing protein n=1 Tax=Ganoderma sinense ZZ0214-1 TaxID=1077348 RepID=A0A2G8S314_9APHY|nr:hypothetical protein GSI_09710 [Ganoderma sinense ZZ0214-1]